VTAVSSGLFLGGVVHTRVRPKRHRLSYKAYWLLIDIDDVETIARGLWLLSHNRFNLFGLHDRDYGEGSNISLREQVDAALRREGNQIDATRVLLLTMPRLLGYVFNPISVYFCYTIDHRLATIIYEVRNTFGERHTYVLAVDGPARATVQQECDKVFHVSPFIAMDVVYAFQVKPPGERISIAIRGRDNDGPVINTALSGQRRDLSDAGLIRAFFSIPFLTLKVILAIHWEALRMWLKGFRIFPHPASRRSADSPKTMRHRT